MALSKIQTNSLTDAAIQSNRNLIINGSATIHQRGNQTSSSGSAVYFVDRWSLYHNTAAAANLQQSTVVPSGQGFSNSILIDCTTADTSVASSDTAVLRQIIEGQNLQRLAYGTSDAKSITLSFWVRSTKTGTYICNIYHADSTARSQSQQYTISQADTWEKKALIFSGDTSIAADNDNAATFYVQWGLMIGSDLSSGTLNTSWENTVDANRFVGQVNFFDSTSNNFYLTGVQLEVGAETPFEHEDTSTTLRKCQRYYAKSWSQGSAVTTNPGVIGATCCGNVNRAFGNVFWPVTMRTAPTVTWYSGSTGTTNKWRNASSGTDITAAAAIAGIGESGYGFVLSAGIDAVTDTLQGHYEAAAEL